MAGHGSLLEVKYRWNIDDLMDSHEVQDIKEEVERAEIERRR